MRLWLSTAFFIAFALPLQAAEILRAVSFEMQPYTPSREASGILTEVVQDALLRIGFTLTIDYVPLSRAHRALSNGSHDLLIPAFIEDKPEADWLYSAPIFEAHFGFLTRSGEKVPPAPIPMEPPLGRDQMIKQLDMLNQGRLRRLLVEKFVAADLIVQQRPHMLQTLSFKSLVGEGRSFRIAIPKSRKNAPALMAAFDKAIEDLKREGRVEDRLRAQGLIDPVSTPGILRIIALERRDQGLFMEMGRKFEVMNPGLVLRWQFVDERMLRRRILRSMAFQESSFDLITLGNYDTKLFRDYGWLADFVQIPKEWNDADFLEMTRMNVQQKSGHFTALPFESAVSATYFRRDWFEKAGLKRLSQPSLQDLINAASRLHKPKEGVYGICASGLGAWSQNMAILSNLAVSGGAKWFDDSWRPLLNEDPWRSTLTTFVEMLRRYGPPDPDTMDERKALATFKRGACAILLDSTRVLPELRNSAVSGSFELTDAPYFKTPTGHVSHWTWSLAVPLSSANIQKAQELALWLTSPAFAQAIASRSSWLHAPQGVRHSTQARAELRRLEPFSGFLEDSLRRMTFPDRIYPDAEDKDAAHMIEIWPAIGDTVGRRFQEALSGKRSISQALQDAQSDTTQIMYQAGFLSPR